MKLYIKFKSGDKWDRAQKVIDSPQTSEYDDLRLSAIFDELKKSNPIHDMYLRALKIEVVRTSSAFDPRTDELVIFVECHNLGTHRVSTQFFYDRSLTELWVLKVRTSSELGMLLHDKLKEFAERAGPEVIEDPNQVKFLKGNVLHAVNLQTDELYEHTARHLVYVEYILRNHGFSTQAKIEAANQIQSYAQMNMKDYKKFQGELRKKLGIPLILPTGLSSRREQLADSKLHKNLPEVEEPEEGEFRREDSQS